MVELFQLQENLLRLFGHSFSPKTKLHESLSKFGLIFLAIIALTQYFMLAFAYNNAHNVEKLSAVLSIFFTGTLTLQKSCTFLYYRQNFVHMIQKLRDMYQQKLQSQEANYLSEANKLANRLGRTYYYSCTGTATYFLVSPVISYITKKIMGTDYVREMPMPMNFHFNTETSPGYEIGYMIIAISTYSVVFYASAIDGLFISFAFNLRAHFQELQRNIRKINFYQTQQEVEQELIAAVSYHVLLLDLAQQLRVMYAPIVFSQFLVTSLDLGVIIFQIITNIDSVMSQVVYFSFLGSIVIQLFIYCYGGELIKIEGLNIDVAVQLSSWYGASPKHRRYLTLIMLRAQRETIIKAGFYEASLANFMTICRAALSFIALIRSIVN